MSTLKLKLNPNPFLVHGRSQSDNQYLANHHCPEMPRLFLPDSTLSTPPIDRKRKFDDELLVTPVRSNNNEALITPPRSHKRPKTVPSSPIRNNEIYETPKTPSSKTDFNINLNNGILPNSQNFTYSITNPEYYSSSSFSNSNADVTPPQSINGSPKEISATIHSPKVFPANANQVSTFSYMYADTCYPFNIGGSAIGKSEGNLKLKTWRDACNDKVRHQYNKVLKDYNSLSSDLGEKLNKKRNEPLTNLPSITNAELFPSFTKISKAACHELNYPFVNKIDSNIDQIEKDAELLLTLKVEKTQQTKPKATYPLHKSSNIRLPPISEILKLTPFDKSTVHPCALSDFEINQYQNSSSCGIVLNKNSKQFYNGRDIKTNQNIPFNHINYTSLGHSSIPDQSLSFSNYQNQYNYQFQEQPQLYYQTPLQLEPWIKFANKNTQQQNTQNPLKKLSTVFPNNASNAYDELSEQVKSISGVESLSNTHHEVLKQYQSQFKTETLSISKTRKKSTSKVSKPSKQSKKNSFAVAPKKSSRSSSRSTSRKSSNSSSSSKSMNKAVSQNGTTDYRVRTRSSSINMSRSASSESIKTAELPASVETTPKSSPVLQNTQHKTNTNSLLFPYASTINLGNPYPSALLVTPMKAKIPTMKQYKSNYGTNMNNDKTSHTTVSNKSNNSNHHHHFHSSKKCMSCSSTSSPCWRPSWAPEVGQLCNSCGLRYRKTKARCLNASCLKIPSKSEWSLMEKRGKVMLDTYDAQGNVNRELSYRCLDCDHEIEVLR